MRNPRSTATQHMTFDATKCFGSPRISQMPWSGSANRSMAWSTNEQIASQTAAWICPPRRCWIATASRSIPHTSCWCWSKAPLPTRTGRELR